MAKPKNYNTVRYGTSDGEIQFGHMHTDGVTSAFSVRSAYDDLHYMQMDVDGDREGYTINRCPGVYQIQCGDYVKDDQPALFIEALNGDIIISAPNGRIRMQAENIDIIAKGPDNKNGNVIIDANEKIELRSKNLETNQTAVCKLYSSGTIEAIGDGLMSIYGGLIESVDGATQVNRSKFSTELESREAQIVG